MKFVRNWSSGVTFVCRSPTGHVDTPDSALDGHSVERGWPGSPVRISWGLVHLDGGSAFRNKDFLVLAPSSLSSFCAYVGVPRGFSCHGQGEMCYLLSFLLWAELSLLLTPALTATGNICNSEVTSLVGKTPFGCQNAFFWPEISLYLPKYLVEQF